MGRPRKPTAIKTLTGTARQNPGRLNKREPKPPSGEPQNDMAHLTEEAQRLWPQFSAILQEIKVLTVADGFGLYAMVEAAADLVRYRKNLRDLGDPIVESITDSGSTMYRAHPYVALVSDAERRLGFWLSKFGLTPADRGRVSSDLKPEKKSGFADI